MPEAILVGIARVHIGALCKYTTPQPCLFRRSVANACSLASLRAIMPTVGTLPSRTLVQMFSLWWHFATSAYDRFIFADAGFATQLFTNHKNQVGRRRWITPWLCGHGRVGCWMAQSQSQAHFLLFVLIRKAVPIKAMRHQTKKNNTVVMRSGACWLLNVQNWTFDCVSLNCTAIVYCIDFWNTANHK